MIEFFVPGKPVGKGRPLASVRGGRVSMRTPEKTRDYEGLVAHYASVARRASGESFATIYVDDGRKVWARQHPVLVSIELRFLRPKGHRKADLAWRHHTQKPDIDNVAKAILDGLVLGGVISDDTQVVGLSILKRWVTDSVEESARVKVGSAWDREYDGGALEPRDR